MKKPLCFVIIPTGAQKDTEGIPVNFDTVYHALIKPAVEAAAMEPIRADETTISSQPIRECLTLCDYAIADLTTADADVCYQLGVRQVLKPATTIAVFATTGLPPSIADSLPSLPYEYDAHPSVASIDDCIARLTQQLLSARNQRAPDNSLYQLVDGSTFRNIVAHEKTDVFRDQVMYNETVKTAVGSGQRSKGE